MYKIVDISEQDSFFFDKDTLVGKVGVLDNIIDWGRDGWVSCEFIFKDPVIFNNDPADCATSVMFYEVKVEAVK